MEAPEVPVDYRFQLANERTFLAWLRTALGLIAGGVALDQFVQPQSDEGVVVFVSLCTIAAGALLAVIGTFRWARTDAAMRSGLPLPRSPLIVIVGALFAVLALVVAIAVLVT
jgi:putative membrane protein